MIYFVFLPDSHRSVNYVNDIHQDVNFVAEVLKHIVVLKWWGVNYVSKILHLSSNSLRLTYPQTNMAEGTGFEPAVPCGTHPFQGCTLDHSDTPPCTFLL